MVPLTRHGWREMLIGSLVLAITAVGLGILFWPLALVVVPVYIWLFAFFRDPNRQVPAEQHWMVSPADGKISDITELPHDELIGGPAVRVGIFLSVFNVHMNRSPCDGRVLSIKYKKGKFINAMKHGEASDQNESNTIVLAEPNGDKPIVVVKQIVGLIARRIVCTVATAEKVQRGQRIGMIKFGSRTELTIAKSLDPLIKVEIGQVVRGAADIVAILGKPIHTQGPVTGEELEPLLPPGDAGMSEKAGDPSGAQKEIARLRRRSARLRRSREQRRLRLRRHGRRAYIRSVYFLPSMATLGNAVCGFGAIYVAAMASTGIVQHDPLASFLAEHAFSAAAYLIFLAMLFDVLDGRLARFARHTTDFGGQLDSLADMVSFGAAPAFIALQLFKSQEPDLQLIFSRLIWSFGALFMSCAAIRLARFNVSNEHGEQHHFSFLGPAQPCAAGTVASMVLMHQELRHDGLNLLAQINVWLLPFVVLGTGLLMVSHFRYPHIVNRYLRGKRSIGRLILVLAFVLLLVVAHQYTICVGTLAYAAWGPLSWLITRLRRRGRLASTSHGLPEKPGPA